MAEYIERKALRDALYDADAITMSGVKILNQFPVADVVTVRHGRWEKQNGLYSCSECGKTCPYDVQADVIEYWACNYCPKCGAKMDLEDREDNNANKEID